MKEPWKVASTTDGFKVVKHGRCHLTQRWHWANHPEGDPRRRRDPHVGMWVCGSRPLKFIDYYKAKRTAARLNKVFAEGAQRRATKS